MKTAKRLLALALAGVMALALLTGCSGGKTEDRRIAENVADIMKRSHPNVKEVSYSVPELSGAVGLRSLRAGSTRPGQASNGTPSRRMAGRWKSF